GGAHVFADGELHAHRVALTLGTDGYRFAELDGAAVFQHGAIRRALQVGQLAQYLVHAMPVHGVVDVLEEINIRAAQWKWRYSAILASAGQVDRLGQPSAPSEPVVVGGAAEKFDAVIGEARGRQGVLVHADPEALGFDSPTRGTLELHTHV